MAGTISSKNMKINQILLVKMLKKHGCMVDVTANGQEAVDALKTTAYDMIFMDCQMPVMDGYEATKIIRETEQDKHNIIIAVTADAMIGDREKCFNAGMDDYLNKPISQDRVSTMLNKWLNPGSPNFTGTHEQIDHGEGTPAH